MTEQEGISILIPVYNTDVRELVRSLSDDASRIDTPYEIICIDDASHFSIKKINRFITTISTVHYEELNENIGRSAIRNLLAQKASFNFLIFLDCDSGILPGFLFRYLSYRQYDVVIGGRMYTSTPPGPEYTLHWKVGSSRELYIPEERQKDPYEHFMLNNLMIRRETFLNTGLDENLIGYGHEDTKFGLQLKKKGVDIKYIHNSVFHLGLDSNKDFLKKTSEGIKNLYSISKEGYGTNSSLYKAFLKVKKSGMINSFYFSGKVIKKTLERNLLSSNPSLTFFDLYKLYEFVELYKKDPQNISL